MIGGFGVTRLPIVARDGLTGHRWQLYSRPLRDAGFRPPKAPVAELVDALDSKSSSARSAGSIPARGTILRSLRELRLGRPLRSIVSERAKAASAQPEGRRRATSLGYA
jgi:hypothetical protein